MDPRTVDWAGHLLHVHGLASAIGMGYIWAYYLGFRLDRMSETYEEGES